MIKFTAEALELSPEVARALLAFMHGDNGPPHLRGIGIDEGDVCATDGQAAVRFERVDVDGCSPTKFNGRVFSRAFVEARLKERGEAKAAVVLPWAKLEPDYVVFAKLSKAEPKDGVRDDDLPIAWDAGLLAKLNVAARACRRERIKGEEAPPCDPPAMLTSLGGYLDPMRFTIGGTYWNTSVHEAFVTIMPMNMRARGATSDEKTVARVKEKTAKAAAEAARKQLAGDQRKREAEARKAAKLAIAEAKRSSGAAPAGGIDRTREDERARVELSRLSGPKLAEPWSGRDAQKQVLSNVLSGRQVTREQRVRIAERMTERPLSDLGFVVAAVLGVDEVAA